MNTAKTRFMIFELINRSIKSRLLVHKLKEKIKKINFVDFGRKICFYVHFEFSDHFKLFSLKYLDKYEGNLRFVFVKTT
jgi:hypothetical protein